MLLLLLLAQCQHLRRYNIFAFMPFYPHGIGCACNNTTRHDTHVCILYTDLLCTSDSRPIHSNVLPMEWYFSARCMRLHQPICAYGMVVLMRLIYAIFHLAFFMFFALGIILRLKCPMEPGFRRIFGPTEFGFWSFWNASEVKIYLLKVNLMKKKKNQKNRKTAKNKRTTIKFNLHHTSLRSNQFWLLTSKIFQ